MSERDLELYERIQKQDKHALELLYERYEKLLFSFSFRVTRRRELSEEIVQEVFIKLWTKPGIYDESKGKFSSWILTVTRNTGIDYLRKKNENMYELEDRDALKNEEPSVEEMVEWKEKGKEIRSAISQLALEQQQMVELFYFKGLSQQKIADTLKIPLGTVKGRIRLALKHLKKDLASAEQGRDRGYE
ncbi:RNA polymerase sigma factor [Pseudalkalibacillus decolorationis]|uniref:RNA polymerase sigma factor n=1 Tax=Pseudalkalibacillus decolorationis TaxID=163879 RepID=UPI0021479A1D|nr:sigma-70 family RNA polymerase sigma factor [Pseudalkalibacillus decolorationis]